MNIQIANNRLYNSRSIVSNFSNKKNLFRKIGIPKLLLFSLNLNLQIRVQVDGGQGQSKVREDSATKAAIDDFFGRCLFPQAQNQTQTPIISLSALRVRVGGPGFAGCLRRLVVNNQLQPMVVAHHVSDSDADAGPRDSPQSSQSQRRLLLHDQVWFGV